MWMDTIQQGAAELKVPVTEGMLHGFAEHARLLAVWNRKVNLTAITDPREVAVKHFVDSLAPVPWLPHGATVLDIGSGAGFPGIPVKVVRPDLRVVLVDAVRKKVSFLQQVIRSLELTGISARHARAEALAGEPEMAGAFDVVICRALSELADFVALASPLMAPGGLAAALKGRVSRDELDRGRDAAARMPRSFEPESRHSFRLRVHRYRLPVLGAERNLVFFTSIES